MQDKDICCHQIVSDCQGIRVSRDTIVFRETASLATLAAADDHGAVTDWLGQPGGIFL